MTLTDLLDQSKLDDLFPADKRKRAALLTARVDACREEMSTVFAEAAQLIAEAGNIASEIDPDLGDVFTHITRSFGTDQLSDALIALSGAVDA